MKKAYLAALIAFIATTASAHPGFNKAQITAGDYHTVGLRITHGCGGSPTKKVIMTIPEGAMSVKPRVLSGWKIDIETEKLAKPMVHHGIEVNELVKSIIWSGNGLPDDQFEVFEIGFMTPNSPGARMDFPVEQICKKGEILWNEIAGPGQNPSDFNQRAPFIMLTPRQGNSGY